MEEVIEGERENERVTAAAHPVKPTLATMWRRKMHRWTGEDLTSEA